MVTTKELKEMAIIDRTPVERLSVISNPCGRCGGTGEVPFWNEALGESDTTYCGICAGSGTSTLRFDTIGATASPIPVTRHFADGVSAVRSTGAAKRGSAKRG